MEACFVQAKATDSNREGMPPVRSPGGKPRSDRVELGWGGIGVVDLVKRYRYRGVDVDSGPNPGMSFEWYGA